MQLREIVKKPALQMVVSGLSLGSILFGAQYHEKSGRENAFREDGEISIYAQSGPDSPPVTLAYLNAHPKLMKSAKSEYATRLEEFRHNDPAGYAQRMLEERIRKGEYNDVGQNDRFKTRTNSYQTLLFEHGVNPSISNPYNVSLEDIDFMTRVVATEVGENEPSEGIDGVINVVLNRYENGCFPRSIREILDAQNVDGDKEFAAIHWAPSVFPSRGYDGSKEGVFRLYAAGFSSEFARDVQGRIIEHLFYPDNKAHGTLDNTGGATFYANNELENFTGMKTSGGPLERTLDIGLHGFYAMPNSCPR